VPQAGGVLKAVRKEGLLGPTTVHRAICERCLANPHLHPHPHPHPHPHLHPHPHPHPHLHPHPTWRCPARLLGHLREARPLGTLLGTLLTPRRIPQAKSVREWLMQFDAQAKTLAIQTLTPLAPPRPYMFFHTLHPVHHPNRRRSSSSPRCGAPWPRATAAARSTPSARAPTSRSSDRRWLCGGWRLAGPSCICNCISFLFLGLRRGRSHTTQSAARVCRACVFRVSISHRFPSAGLGPDSGLL